MPDFKYYPRGSVSDDGRFKHLTMQELDHGISEAPWELWVAPFRVAPHVWMISGNYDICSYLIDTGDGLVVIDSPTFQTLYQQMESIRISGFDPKQIRHIWVSHAHGDHYGGARALKEYTGADIWMGKDDTLDLAKRKTAGKSMPLFDVHDWSVDTYYDDNNPYTMGNVTFRFRIAPGHSAGACCYFFEDTDDETGKTYKICMHGGTGASGSTENLKRLGYPVAWHQQFIDDCAEMAEMPCDIALASHENQMNFYSGVNPEDPSDYSGFVDSDSWKTLLLNRAEAVRQLG